MHINNYTLASSNDDQPTKEASAARKRLLDAFAQYDAFAKRIRAIPCNTGSSQSHVQLAVLSRANLFLQKHMFPLQVRGTRFFRYSELTSTLRSPCPSLRSVIRHRHL